MTGDDIMYNEGKFSTKKSVRIVLIVIQMVGKCSMDLSAFFSIIIIIIIHV